MATEAQKRAVRKYDAKNTRQYHLKLNLTTDADIIEHLAGLESVQGYIKALIRADMKANIIGCISYYNRISALPDCNTCGRQTTCGHCPEPGEQTRINCPLWEGKKQK